VFEAALFEAALFEAALLSEQAPEESTTTIRGFFRGFFLFVDVCIEVTRSRKGRGCFVRSRVIHVRGIKDEYAR
jgi:hypothetical protein